ncbi:hypothetical protein COLO4_11144 [Corchorus olitorius]|uniref:Uncharacterized protein n=1 Tax=Corchorus olitorius TaxID=93759 RepID=A0A1R3K5M8_9ROSI|nr:hypothetical protein COLO4_11144 [Corchorus olitorius]
MSRAANGTCIATLRIRIARGLVIELERNIYQSGKLQCNINVHPSYKRNQMESNIYPRCKLHRNN